MTAGTTAAERTAALRRAQEAMRAAQKAAEEAARYCALAKCNLEDARRAPEAMACEMICTSLHATVADLSRWRPAVGQQREGEP